MSFNAYLHAYCQPYGEDPVLSQAWYEISNPDVPADAHAVEEFFVQIAKEYASDYANNLDPSVLGDFNWGDFVVEIPDWFLEQHGVREIPGNSSVDVQVFTEHDEHILDRW